MAQNKVKNSLIAKNSNDITGKKFDRVDEFLKKKFNIENVLDYEFEDLSEKDITDYDVSNVRGNIQLMERQILTVKESEELLDHALALDFSIPEKFKL